MAKFNPFWYIAGVYLLLALLYTAALLLQGNGALIGTEYRGSLSLWATWWPGHAIHNNYNLVSTDYTLFPVKTNLLPVLSLTTSLVYIPLRAILGPLLAYHVILPLYLTLNAISGYLFLRKRCENGFWIPALGGLVLAFNPVTWELARRGEFALLGFFPLIFSLLAWERLVEKPSTRNTVWVAIALYTVVLMSIQFWNLLLTFWLPYAVYTGWRSPNRAKLIDSILLAVIVFSLLFAIYPASSLLWSSYVEKYKHIEVWQGVVNLSGVAWQVFTVGGLLAVLLSLFAPWKTSPDRRLWILIFGINLLAFNRMELAPLSLTGRLFVVPHHTDLTQSAIFLFATFLAALVVVSGAVQHAGQVLPPRARHLILAGFGLGILLVSGWNLTLPVTPLPHADAYAFMADEPENYTIISFPIGVDSLARQQFTDEALAAEQGYVVFGYQERAGEAMAYAPWHGKRVLGGLTGHITNNELEIYNSHPLTLIAAHREIEGDAVEVAKIIRNDVRRWRVAYVLTGSAVTTTVGLQQWFNWTGAFCLINQGAEIEIWRASWHPAGCPAYRLDIGTPDDHFAVGEGWYNSEEWPDRYVRWAGGDLVSELTLWATPRSDYTLRFYASSPSVPNQTVKVVTNGVVLGTFSITPEWEEYDLILPRMVIAEGGLVEIELRHSSTENIEGRDLTAVYDYILLEEVD